ncbi:MAG: AbrB/MazE/SpoVT family DNA-binding domain-containing protein [Burkholderiaceae bacterium]
MQVTEKGQVTIPKHIRTAAGVLPGSEVAFALEAGKIVISKVGSGIKTDRREQLRAAAARVRKSMSPEFRQMSADAIMAFLRADTPSKPSRRGSR